MIQWTTPTLSCSIPPEITGDYVLLTISNSIEKIEKKVDFSEIENGNFTIKLSQKETSLFQVGSMVNAQINVMSGKFRTASNIIQLTIGRNLHDEVIENE